MLIIPKSDFLKFKEKNIELIKYGAIFIYPTDTIYGIGCDARNPTAIKKIREIKQSTQAFSAIIPSKDWIQNNLVCRKSFDKWFEKLPGPYTLIMKIRDARCVSRELLARQKTVGVRIPNNWFSGFVAEAGLPVVTTSVNVHGQKPITSVKDIPESIKNKVDFVIDD